MWRLLFAFEELWISQFFKDYSGVAFRILRDICTMPELFFIFRFVSLLEKDPSTRKIHNIRNWRYDFGSSTPLWRNVASLRTGLLPVHASRRANNLSTGRDFLFCNSVTFSMLLFEGRSKRVHHKILSTISFRLWDGVCL